MYVHMCEYITYNVYKTHIDILVHLYVHISVYIICGCACIYIYGMCMYAYIMCNHIYNFILRLVSLCNSGSSNS